MKKKENYSLTLGIIFGLIFGYLFDHLAIGLAIGISLGAAGLFQKNKLTLSLDC